MVLESDHPGPAGEKPDLQATVSYQQIEPQLRSDRYSFEHFHARGGMGEVWLAKDREINRLVAVKRLRSDHQDSQDRFAAEAQITGQLEHPGVIPVHDFGLDEDGHPFYVMKFVHGQTLKESISDYYSPSGPSGSDGEVQRLQFLEVLVDLCHAVAFAHSRGVLHRDLKPDNVMLGPYGETLLLDWGLAKVLDQPEDELPSGSSYVRLTRSRGSTETQAGSVLGAPSYMAPEVAEGKIAEVDQTTDVYLLGGCLYEILTGEPPRRGSSHPEMVEMARTVDPVPPREKRKDVPRALDAICRKAMARRKQDRYQSVEELAADVQRHLAGEPVSAYREGVLSRVWRWGKRHRGGLGRLLATVLVAGSALFAMAKMREARTFREQEAARGQIAEFRNWAGQARYYLASTNRPDQRAPYYRPEKGNAAVQKALEISGSWGPGLGQLPLTEERDALEKELYELLLLSVQSKQQSASGPEQVERLLQRLEQARSFSKPSRSFYRLQAELFGLLEDKAKATRASEEAEDPQTRSTALDHFLQGEALRMQSAARSDAPAGSSTGKPDRPLLEEAIQAYRAAIQEAPDHYWSHFQLGRCYDGLGRQSEAVEALGTCVALEPDAPWGYTARGLALALSGRFAEAERDLDLAVQGHPEFRPAKLNRGVAFWLQKKYKKALADFEAVLQPPGESRLIEAAYYRGQIYLQRRQYPEALQDFDRVVAEKPSFRQVYPLRARTHFLLREQAKAIEDLTILESLDAGENFDPESAQAYQQRGQLLRRMVGRLPAAARKPVYLLALDQLQKAVDSGPPSAQLFDELGAVLYKMRRMQEALDAFSKGIELDPQHVALRINRGLILAQHQKQYQAALTDFLEAARLQPTDGEVHSHLGYVYACLKQPASARQHITLALLHGSGNYTVLHNVACAYAELSQSGDSLADEHQDLAIALLATAVEHWGSDDGINIIELIKGDSALDPLRTREDFRKLIKEPGL